MRIIEGLIKPEMRMSKYMLRTYDAETPSGLKILTWFDADIFKLKLVKETVESDDEQFLLLCFPWQEDLIRTYLGESVVTKVYSYEKIINILRKE